MVSGLFRMSNLTCLFWGTRIQNSTHKTFAVYKRDFLEKKNGKVFINSNKYFAERQNYLI